MQLLPLDRYTANNDLYIQAERSGGNVTGGILTTASLRNSAGSSAYANKGENGFDGLGTFTQAGIASGYQIFQAIPQGVADNTGTQYTATMPSGRTCTVTRQPVLVLVSDGEPTHCTNIYNDPLNGPFYGDGTYLSYEDTYQQVFNVLDKHPNLPVTFAHFFFYSEKPEQLAQVFAKYPGTSVDVTPGSEMYGAFLNNREFYRDFFTRYADRIFYGTDTSFSGGDMTRFSQRARAVQDFICTDKEMTVIRVDTKGLALDADVQQKILGGNFRRVAGQTPKTIDPKALKDYMEKYLPLITDKAMRAFCRREAEKL
jgi:hypothetical protein